jgi:hypothetical protein
MAILIRWVWGFEARGCEERDVELDFSVAFLGTRCNLQSWLPGFFFGLQGVQSVAWLWAEFQLFWMVWSTLMLRESFDSIMDVLLVEAESLRYMIT